MRQHYQLLRLHQYAFNCFLKRYVLDLYQLRETFGHGFLHGLHDIHHYHKRLDASVL